MTTRKLFTVLISMILAAIAVAWCVFATVTLVGQSTVSPSAAYWAGTSDSTSSIRSTDTVSVVKPETLKYFKYTFSYTANGENSVTSDDFQNPNPGFEGKSAYDEDDFGELTCTATMSIVEGDSDEVKTEKSRYIGLTLPAVVIFESSVIADTIAQNNTLTVTGIQDTFNGVKLAFPEVVPILVARAGAGSAEERFRLYLFDNVKVDSAEFHAEAAAMQNVEEVVVPSNVTSIRSGDGMFLSGMPNLKKVIFESRSVALTIDEFCFINNAAAGYHLGTNGARFSNINLFIAEPANRVSLAQPGGGS